MKEIHNVNGIAVEQRISDGFINGTAMCVAHGKQVRDWLKTKETQALIKALAEDLDIEVKEENYLTSSATGVSAIYPALIITKMGSPANGGGVWLHPDLAIQLAQWCNPVFAIQVSRWVREWIVQQSQPQPPQQHYLADWKSSRDFAKSVQMAFQNYCWVHKYQPAYVHDELTKMVTGMTAHQHRQLPLVGDDPTIGLDHLKDPDALALLAQAKINLCGIRGGCLEERIRLAVADAKRQLKVNHSQVLPHLARVN